MHAAYLFLNDFPNVRKVRQFGPPMPLEYQFPKPCAMPNDRVDSRIKTRQANSFVWARYAIGSLPKVVGPDCGSVQSISFGGW